MTDQAALWHNLCRAHVPPIEPQHATWADIALQRSLRNGPSPGRGVRDESFDYDSEEDSGVHSLFGTPGVTPTASPLPRGSSSLRRAVWERPNGMLPTYQRSTPFPSVPALSQDPFASGTEPPILSHLVLPTAVPKVNYKHLYLVRRILSRRMTDTRPADLEAASRRTPSLWEPDVQILTSGSSTQMGGLPGHSESIYSLHLFQRPMRVLMATGDADELVYGLSQVWPSPARDNGGMSTSWPGPGTPGRAKAHVVSGRDWLLSGSRDCTLRLWQIGCARPRVVKIYSGGHNRSILTHFVTELQDADTGRVRLMAISAGSDGRICSWDIEGDGRPEKVVQAHSDSIFFMRGDGERLVSCSKDRTIRVFDIRTLECTLVIDEGADGAGHRGAINAVGLTDAYVVSASGDKSIRVWDIHTGRLITSYEAHHRGISSIGFEPCGAPELSGWKPTTKGAVLKATLVTGSSDSTIKTFHLVEVPREYADEDQVTFQDMMVDAPAATASDTRVVIQPGVEYWARCACPMPMTPPNSHGCLRCNNRGHTELVRSLHIGEDVTLSASYDSTIKMWERQTGRLIFDFEGCHSGRVFAITGDRMRVVSSGLDARIAIIDFSQGLDTAFV